MSVLRILHLRSSSGLYGAEQMLLGLASEQLRQGLQSTVMAFVRPGQVAPELLAEAARRGLPVHALACSGMFDPGCLRRLRAQLRALARDGNGLLHCHDYKSVAYAWLAGFGLPLRRVSTAHGWLAGGRRLRAYRALELRGLRHFDRVCAVSLPIADQLQQSGLRPQQIRVVANGIDTEHYRPDQGSRTPGPLRLGTAVRLSPEKNLAQLLDALARCRSLGHSLHLTILGEGPLRSELSAQIERLQLGELVNMPGASTKLEAWYPQLDAFVLVSLSEGMPLAVLEALACGCPVLASDVGALPELLAGLTGCQLVPVGDLTALVAALCALRPRTAPLPALRQRVVERYSLTQMAAAYNDVYRQALAA
jgi:glycosyltransferase involved in cell wall biosynthesis